MMNTWFDKRLLPAYLLSLIVFVWLLTFGSFNLIFKDNQGGFFDAQAESLIHGRLDIMRIPLVGGEAFERDGKTYIYFGLAPAILHAPLMAVPYLRTRLSRLFMVVGLILTMMALTYFINRFWMGPDRPWLKNVLLTLLTLGSSTLFLGSFSFVYHEAQLLGSAFLLMTLAYVSQVIDNKRKLSFGLLLALLFFTMFTRQTYGFSAFCAVGIAILTVLWRDRKFSKELFYWILAPVIITCLVIAVNWIKFRTILDGHPLYYHVQVKDHPERLERLKNTLFHIENIPNNFITYVFTRNLESKSEFPFLYIGNRVPILPEAIIDGREDVTGLITTAPLLLFLFIAGLVAAFKYRRTLGPQLGIIASAGAGIAIILSWGFLSERFKHDFFPILALTSILGISWIYNFCPPFLRKALSVLLVFLVVGQVLVHVILGLNHQNFIWSAQQEAKDHYALIKSWFDNTKGPSVPTP